MTKTRADVFSEHRLNSLLRAVNAISSRMSSVLKLEITTEELCDAFIKPEDIPILMRAKEILDAHPWEAKQMVCTVRNYDGHDCNVVFTPKGKLDYSIPRYAKNGSVSPKFSDDTWLRVHTYVMSLAKIAERRQLCVDIVNHLNSACRDIAQFKVAFPFLLQLAQHAEDKSLVEAIQKAPTPRQFAALSPKARTAAAEAALFLNKALLIPTGKSDQDVVVDVNLPKVHHDFR